MPDHMQQAHKYCTHNGEQLRQDTLCGCFYCLKIFHPKEIHEWLEGEDTALCPYCGIDSVIGSYSRFPITKAFLEEMKKFYF